MPHVHTPHSLGIWKKRQMENDYPEETAKFEKQYNFTERIHRERILYTEADLVVATTPQQFDLLKKDYGLPRDNCRMIPPGYDDNRFFPVGEVPRNAFRQRLGFSGKVVMAIGRLARNKGYDLLIQGFSVLARREAEAVLHLAVGGTNLYEHESDSWRIEGEGQRSTLRAHGLFGSLRRALADYLSGGGPVRPLQPL